VALKGCLNHGQSKLGSRQVGFAKATDPGLLPRIVCHREDNEVEVQAIAGLYACQNMSVVRWIEGSAENADPAGVVAGHVGEATGWAIPPVDTHLTCVFLRESLLSALARGLL
jgi:hypothetical protein